MNQEAHKDHLLASDVRGRSTDDRGWCVQAALVAGWVDDCPLADGKSDGCPLKRN